MRTTLDIDDDVLQAAKERAKAEGKTAGQVASELMRKALTSRPSSEEAGWLTIKRGIPILPTRGGIVTKELVDRLIEEADLADARLSLKK